MGKRSINRLEDSSLQKAATPPTTSQGRKFSVSFFFKPARLEEYLRIDLLA